MRLRRAYLPPVKTLAKRSQVYNNRSESEDTSSDISALGGGCAGCGRKRNVSNWTMIHPCGHILCWTCFSATIASVTKSHAASKCTACQGDCLSIKRHYGPVPKDNGPEHCNAVNPGASTPCCSDTIVLRIDNVDVTPQIVENFLPKNVLPQEHPQPIHILIDRFDGRTKDYMYIEAASDVTARKILKKRQNGMMPCGGQDGKTRAVTITRVTHHELSAELRPKGPQELTALLALCQAAVALPNRADRDLCHSPSVTRSGLAHFVKSRHGPFYAIMSILTKLRGPESPAYWDLFNLTSGIYTVYH
ncbi:hypothetical protein BD324DRAFT_461194 [Kockovaella imperatae]|uniref:RING-type domain-containing protein n=1 Tax=Kockovaella imperatae TaxID=4999 RepID=A0A1Y1UHX3_9TREE|nr:hypothetical protein BD324DRAFT_461194 [Kockovaella imperatae]ORX36685.1 hypothetical protein BD324DRAFT_461194 [Kockovaella imperatae]